MRVIVMATLAGLWALPAEAGERTASKGVKRQSGVAAWYGGRRKVHGVTFKVVDETLTAAHRTWPLGTRVLVTNRKNGRTVEVTITDRGPRSRRRIIDVSRTAADRLGMVSAGTARVVIETIPSPPVPMLRAENVPIPALRPVKEGAVTNPP